MSDVVVTAASRPMLAHRVYLRWDRHADTMMLLGPERGLFLDPVAAEVVGLCDGERSLEEIVAALAGRYPATDRERILTDVIALVDALCRRRLLECQPPAGPPESTQPSSGGAPLR